MANFYASLLLTRGTFIMLPFQEGGLTTYIIGRLQPPREVEKFTHSPLLQAFTTLVILIYICMPPLVKTHPLQDDGRLYSLILS